MPVILVMETKGLDQKDYDSSLEQLYTTIKTAKGFKGHFAGPNEGGWQVVEVWDSKEDADRWFAAEGKRLLPSKARPSRKFVSIHHAVFP